MCGQHYMCTLGGAKRWNSTKIEKKKKKVTSENVFSQVISHSGLVAVYVSVHFVFHKFAFLLQWKSFAGPNRHVARSLRKTVTRPKIACLLWWTPTADWWGKHDISRGFPAVWARVLKTLHPMDTRVQKSFKKKRILKNSHWKVSLPDLY